MRYAKRGNRRVYDRGHSNPCDWRKNPMPKPLIIPPGLETHLPAIADDAMQKPGPAGSEAGR